MKVDRVKLYSLASYIRVRKVTEIRVWFMARQGGTQFLWWPDDGRWQPTDEHDNHSMVTETYLQDTLSAQFKTSQKATNTGFTPALTVNYRYFFLFWKKRKKKIKTDWALHTGFTQKYGMSPSWHLVSCVWCEFDSVGGSHFNVVWEMLLLLHKAVKQSFLSLVFMYAFIRTCFYTNTLARASAPALPMYALDGWKATSYIASSDFFLCAVTSCTHVLLSMFHKRMELSWLPDIK